MTITRKVEMTLGTKETGLVRWAIEGGLDGCTFHLIMKRKAGRKGEYSKTQIFNRYTFDQFDNYNKKWNELLGFLYFQE